VLIRDYETQILTAGSSADLTATKLGIIDNENCMCTNMLEEANFIFIVDPNISFINAVYLDIILTRNVKAKCKQKFIMNQSYSTKFLNSLDDNVMRSGSPGYFIGSRLWIGYTTTNNSGTKVFEVPKEGLFMVGKKKHGTCGYVNNSSESNIIESFYDSPINYGVNTIYSCNLILDYTQFEDFCNRKDWINLKLFKFPANIQLIGIFGNANYEFKNVKIQMIKYI
jgi:hypothetical protein